MRLITALRWTTAGWLVVAPFAGSAGARATLLLLSALLLVAIHVRSASMRLEMRPWAVPAAFTAWALLCAASALWSVQPAYTLRELRAEVFYGVLAFFVFLLAARQWDWWPTWWRAALLGSLAVFALNLARDAFSLEVTRHDVDGQGGQWSTHVVLMAPLLLPLAWPRFAGAWHTRLQVIALVLVFGAAWDSGNRAVWVALVVQLAVALGLSGNARLDASAWSEGSRRLVLLAALAAAVAFVIAIYVRVLHVDPGASVASALVHDLRPQIWAAAATRFSEAPWLGHGFGREIVASAFGDLKIDIPGHPVVEHSHNLFIDMALQLGIVGLAAFLAVLAALALEYRRYLRDPRSAAFGVVGATLLAGFVAKNMTDDFLHRHNAVVFWALNGMLLGLARSRLANNASAPGDDSGRAHFLL